MAWKYQIKSVGIHGMLLLLNHRAVWLVNTERWPLTKYDCFSEVDTTRCSVLFILPAQSNSSHVFALTVFKLCFEFLWPQKKCGKRKELGFALLRERKESHDTQLGLFAVVLCCHCVRWQWYVQCVYVALPTVHTIQAINVLFCRYWHRRFSICHWNCTCGRGTVCVCVWMLQCQWRQFSMLFIVRFEIESENHLNMMTLSIWGEVEWVDGMSWFDAHVFHSKPFILFKNRIHELPFLRWRGKEIAHEIHSNF